MSANDFFAIATLIFAARCSSEKAAFRWLLIFGFFHTGLLISTVIKGNAA